MPNEWQRYRLAWRLASPLHIGYRTIGTIMRTRLWVPGRNVWGAMIDTLARAQGATPQNPGKFKEVQTAFGHSLRFEAWFVTPGNKDDPQVAPSVPWYPNYNLRIDGEDGLHFGDMPERMMQRMVLGANVSTAIDHGSNVADEGNLFEVEYIAPHVLYGSQKGAPLWLVGHLWAKGDTLLDIDEKKLGIIDLINQYLKELSIGGEQKSGHGRLRDGHILTSDGRMQQGDAPRIAIARESAIPLLVVHAPGQLVRGHVEPIIGRTTKESYKHGANLEPAQFCWVPGSISAQAGGIQLPGNLPGIGILVADSA